MQSKVTTKNELIGVIFELLDDNDAVQWDNDTAYSYLQRLAEYLSEHEMQAPSWQSLADALIASKDS